MAIKTYWTIQTKEAWENAQQVGYLEGAPESISYEYFGEAYEWMKQQMRERLPRYNGEQPVWLWPVKPDMRKSAHQVKGTEIVRLTINLAEEDVLISDFSAWHMVLNDSFNSYTEAEYDAYEKGESLVTKEESWTRIFDKDFPRDEAWCGRAEDETYQGTTGRVLLDSITKVEHFIAK